MFSPCAVPQVEKKSPRQLIIADGIGLVIDLHFKRRKQTAQGRGERLTCDIRFILLRGISVAYTTQLVDLPVSSAFYGSRSQHHTEASCTRDSRRQSPRYCAIECHTSEEGVAIVPHRLLAQATLPFTHQRGSLFAERDLHTICVPATILDEGVGKGEIACLRHFSPDHPTKVEMGGGWNSENR